MKIVFWLVGCPCSGKTTYSKLLAKKLGLEPIHLDSVYNRTQLGMTREEGYKDLLKDIGEVVVMEGGIPFRTDEPYDNDMNIIKELIKDYKLVYVNIELPYSNWLRNWKIRKENPEEKAVFKTEEQYHYYNKLFRKRLGEFILVENQEDLSKVKVNDIKHLSYQKEGFTDLKFKDLKINTKGKSVLDLGCNAGMFENYCEGEYIGLDIVVPPMRKNIYKFDLYELDKWKKKADIVICVSLFHHIQKDKDKFLKECARLTKELFVLEGPVSKTKSYYTSLNRFIPNIEELKKWLEKYFKNVKIVGESTPSDGSYRIVYHCKK
jgi:hypothetical protein